MDEKQVDTSDAADAERFRWMLSEPQGAKHLLQLLFERKGNENSFRNMIDRIGASKRLAESKKKAA